MRGQASWLIPRRILRPFGDQLVLPPLLFEDHWPKLLRLRTEDKVNRRRVRHPRVAAHLVFELAGTPARVSRKHLELLRSRKRFADLDERIQRVPKAQIRDDVRVWQIIVVVEETQRLRLHWPTEKQCFILEGVREV